MLQFPELCVLCDQNIWINYLSNEHFEWEKLELSTGLDQCLEPIQHFQAIIKELKRECRKCKGVPIVCIMGRTGSGKSTLLNILANCKPLYQKDALGLKQIYFENPVTEVGGGVTSLTKFCTAVKIQDAFYIDFAGFFDNRAGQLQVVQHLLIHHLTFGRRFKMLAVKDIRTTRDLPFIEFLNLPWVNRKNTLVVMTHTQSNSDIDLERFSEGRVKKNFKVVMMVQGVKGFSFKSFQRDLNSKISKLEFSDESISMEISNDVYKFQAEALKILQEKIDVEFNRILGEALPKLIIQPYDVDYFRQVFNSKFSLSEAISALRTSRIILDNTDTSSLYKYENQWNLLTKLNSNGNMEGQTWGQLSPSSNEIIVSLNNRLNTFTPPDYLPFEGKSLVKDLKAWNKLSHMHYIEHVSFRARALTLLAKADKFSFIELERLAQYRQSNYLKIMAVWLPLEHRFLAEIDDDSHSPVNNILRTLRMKDARGVLQETLKFSQANRDDVAYLAKIAAKNMSGIAMADGILATGGWLAKSAGITGIVKSTPGIATAGVVFGIAATAALGAYGYHLYLTNRQLQKVRALGFDFSFLRVEKSIWVEIEDAARERNADKVREALSAFDKEFRLFMHSTSQGVIKAKITLTNAKLEGADVSEWQKLIDRVDRMTKNIFVEMKAREYSTLGCYFYEHEWIQRSVFSVKLELVSAKSCCSFFITKMNRECRHCGYIVHSSANCKLKALQTPCKSVIEGQDAKTTKATLFNLIQVNRAVFEDTLKLKRNQDMITASYLSGIVYEELENEEDLVVNEVGAIRYLISYSGSTAFVIVRGTVMNSISNWMTNSTATVYEVSNGQGGAHYGFYKAAEDIYNLIWEELDKYSINEVVFGGHSLGGAIAHCLHLQSHLNVKLKGRKSFSIGFGSPLVFTQPTCKLVPINDFITVVNEHDPVPSIMQAISSGIFTNVLPNPLTPLVNIISREMTRRYAGLGMYLFLDSGGEWMSNDSSKIMDRLQYNTRLNGIEDHQIELYHMRMGLYFSK